MTQIVSKPDWGSILIDENGVPVRNFQDFLDEIEQQLNDNVLGQGLQFPVYVVADLPPAGTQGLNAGMGAYVTDEAVLGSVPVWFDGSVWRRADGVIAS